MGDKIILRHRPTPKVVNLPNGTSFVSKCKRISRKQLPRNIRNTRTKKIEPRRDNRRILVNLAAPALRKIKRRRRQAGRGIGKNLAKLGIEMGSKALNSSFGRRLIKKGINNIGVSKLKTKNLQKALNSEVADIVEEEVQKKLHNP